VCSYLVELRNDLDEVDEGEVLEAEALQIDDVDEGFDVLVQQARLLLGSSTHRFHVERVGDGHLVGDQDDE
jgi:predicted transcriptional regulator of viral defense system